MARTGFYKMILPLLLLLIIPPSLSGKRASSNKTECDFLMPVYFSSLNLINILIWKPPENVTDIRYTVKYIEYGKSKWQKKLECTNITWTWCDLTNETKSGEQYQGKVIMYTKTCKKANKTERFNPVLHTVIGPPTVILSPGDTSITINLTHPIKNIHEIFKGLLYNLYINNSLAKTEDSYKTIENLDPNTLYCITAEVYWREQTSKVSEKACITTNADHTTQQTIAWMIFILPISLIFCTVITIGYGIHKYINANNLKQPKILNIATSNNNNIILVDACNVTMNVITIECGKPNLQDTMMSGKEEDKDLQNKNGVHITDGGDQISCGTDVIDKAEIESNYDDGYVSLQEQVAPAVVRSERPTISPYDMPHQPFQPVILLSASTDTVCEERDFCGNIKSNPSLSPVQESDELPDGYTTEKAVVNYSYLPQGDTDVPNVSKINEDQNEPENSIVGQELELATVTEDTCLNESSTLFIDWTPDNPSFYLQNLSRNKELEICIKQCQEERGALLSQLYLQPEVKGTSEDNELEQMEERWGLLIQNSET